MPIIEEPLKKRLRQQAFLGSSINRLGARLASDVVMMWKNNKQGSFLREAAFFYSLDINGFIF